ncbi:MAG: glycosyltransferase family 39 protein [Sphingomonadales bacterium]|nr:glycosyltransferase family 39 protein [Sphingomonadales bacterium]
MLKSTQTRSEGDEATGRTRWLSPDRAALAVIILVALALRLHGAAFGLPALNDPDELTFELGAVRMLRGPTLNPGWFGHPATTTIYVMAVITAAVFLGGRMFGWFPSIKAFGDAIYADPSWVMLPGRIAMVMFAVGTIYLTYRLASNLFDRRVGLASAALLAVNPVHIVWSQIIRSDVMASFFMLLCMLAALRLQRGGRWRDQVWTSVWLGVSVATKWPSAIAALTVVGVLTLRAIEHPDERRRALVRFCVIGAMSLGFMLLTSPYMLLDYPTLIRNLHGEAQIHHLGATGGTPWENAWWYLRGPILTGLGPAGAVLTAAGLGILARRREALAVVMPAILGIMLMLCVQHLVWERWVIPLMPLLAIAGGAALVALIRLLTKHLPRGVAIGATALVLAVAVLPLALRAQSDTRARLHDTRQLASRWAVEHVPAGSTVLVEHFAFDLQPQPWHFLFPLGERGCIDAKALLGGKVQMTTVEAGRRGRSNVDFGTVAPAMRATCRADYAILTQYDRYAAERSTFPTEYAAYRDYVTRGRLVATFAPEFGKTGGPVVRVIRFSR